MQSTGWIEIGLQWVRTYQGRGPPQQRGCEHAAGTTKEVNPHHPPETLSPTPLPLQKQPPFLPPDSAPLPQNFKLLGLNLSGVKCGCEFGALK